MTDVDERREREITRWRNVAHAYAARAERLEARIKELETRARVEEADDVQPA
jgi:hypothetical protein